MLINICTINLISSIKLVVRKHDNQILLLKECIGTFTMSPELFFFQSNITEVYWSFTVILVHLINIIPYIILTKKYIMNWSITNYLICRS